MKKHERAMLILAARTALRCERLLLKLALERVTERDVMAYNDEMLRFEGYAREVVE